MTFKQGDLVVRKWSKASTLKRRVYTVLHESGSTVHLLDAYGKTRHAIYYQLETLKDAENRCINYIANEKEAVTRAKQRVQKAEQAYRDFIQEMNEIPKFFPKV